MNLLHKDGYVTNYDKTTENNNFNGYEAGTSIVSKKVVEQFIRNGKTYHYLGTNFWYGMNLGSNNKERLLRELDRLNQLGIKNLRIMAASEGDIDAPWRMQPSLQKEPGEYDEDLLMGLDFLLNEMKKRNMLAVVCLNNFWPWSGGFAQYVAWTNGEENTFQINELNKTLEIKQNN